MLIRLIYASDTYPDRTANFGYIRVRTESIGYGP
jgi:hypothetical protein